MHSNQCDNLWTDLHLPITVSFVTPSMICKELLSKHISLNSMRDNEFPSAHARVIQISLSPLLSCFVKTERAIPKENHTRRPDGWLCYSIVALLQSVCGWQCRQITDRASQRGGGNQRKETRGDAVKAYHKPCHRHWELLICSNCHGWLLFQRFVCHQKKWNAFGFFAIPNT